MAIVFAKLCDSSFTARTIGLGIAIATVAAAVPVRLS